MEIIETESEFMKKFLPRSANNPSGFTLVELLVVISIIAILSVVGITLFVNVQKNARDAKRKADIEAMSKAMEANYIQGGGYSTTIADSWFAGGAKPTNPAPGGSTYATNIPTTSSYTFCAALENSTGNSSSSTSFTSASDGRYYCRVQQQ